MPFIGNETQTHSHSKMQIGLHACDSGSTSSSESEVKSRSKDQRLQENWGLGNNRLNNWRDLDLADRT